MPKTRKKPSKKPRKKSVEPIAKNTSNTEIEQKPDASMTTAKPEEASIDIGDRPAIENDIENDIDVDVDIDKDIDKDKDPGISGSVASDASSTDECELRSELQIEVKRLQDEFKRQKALTLELEQEREKLRKVGSGSGFSGNGNGNISRGNRVGENRKSTVGIPQSATITSKSKPEHHEIGFGGGFGIGIDIDRGNKNGNLGSSYLSDSNIETQVTEGLSDLRNELDSLKVRLESKLGHDSINDFEATQEVVDKLSENILGFSKDLQIMRKEVEKNELRLSAVLLDLGFEESLDINKIPNYILVLVYETILNDIIAKMRHALGPQDTESAVVKILDGVRLHTSGGELFKYENNKIMIPELRQYLDKKMISPKQVHITHNSIAEKLLEFIPGYMPKNFKAMIKLKSQEYALDTAAKLETRIELLTERIEELNDKLNTNSTMIKKHDTDQHILKDEQKNMNIHFSKMSTRFDEFKKLIDKQIAQKFAEYAQDQGIKETKDGDLELSVEPEVHGAESESEVEPEAESESEVESEAESGSEVEPKAESESEVESEAVADVADVEDKDVVAKKNNVGVIVLGADDDLGNAGNAIEVGDEISDVDNNDENNKDQDKKKNDNSIDDNTNNANANNTADEIATIDDNDNEN